MLKLFQPGPISDADMNPADLLRALDCTHLLWLWLPYDDQTAPKFKNPQLARNVELMDPAAPHLSFCSGQGCIAPCTTRVLRSNVISSVSAKQRHPSKEMIV
jgi:hypothetical protein